MKKILFVASFLLLSVTVFAQSKIGTINSDLIIASMTELTKVQTDLKIYGGELDTEFQKVATNYQSKIAAYEQDEATLTDALKKTRQEEIFNLENDLQRFRQNSEGLIQIKRDELMRPLYQKLGIALEAVAKEKGYTQVFTMNAGIAYFDIKQDITHAVADKMQITLKQ